VESLTKIVEDNAGSGSEDDIDMNLDKVDINITARRIVEEIGKLEDSIERQTRDFLNSGEMDNTKPEGINKEAVRKEVVVPGRK